MGGTTEEAMNEKNGMDGMDGFGDGVTLTEEETRNAQLKRIRQLRMYSFCLSHHTPSMFPSFYGMDTCPHFSITDFNVQPALRNKQHDIINLARRSDQYLQRAMKVELISELEKTRGKEFVLIRVKMAMDCAKRMKKEGGGEVKVERDERLEKWAKEAALIESIVEDEHLETLPYVPVHTVKVSRDTKEGGQGDGELKPMKHLDFITIFAGRAYSIRMNSDPSDGSISSGSSIPFIDGLLIENLLNFNIVDVIQFELWPLIQKAF